jgi:hypothetical protein
MSESATTGNHPAPSPASLRQRGLREIKLWVPDTHRPGFKAELERQVRQTERSVEQDDDLEFIEQAADWSE